MNTNDVIKYINKFRNSNHLPALKAHKYLMKAAQSHSDDMATHKFLNHNGSDHSTPFTRMKKCGYDWKEAGECIVEVWGAPDPKYVVDQWIADKPHRNILLGKNYVHIGVGESHNYWTADFATGMSDLAIITEDDFDLW